MQEEELASLSPRDRAMAGIGKSEQNVSQQDMLAGLELPEEVTVDNLGQFITAHKQLEKELFRLQDEDEEAGNDANSQRIEVLKSAAKTLAIKMQPAVTESARASERARRQEVVESSDSKQEVSSAVLKLSRLDLDSIDDVSTWLQGSFIRRVGIEDLERAQATLSKLIETKRSMKG